MFFQEESGNSSGPVGLTARVIKAIQKIYKWSFVLLIVFYFTWDRILPESMHIKLINILTLLSLLFLLSYFFLIFCFKRIDKQNNRRGT